MQNVNNVYQKSHYQSTKPVRLATVTLFKRNKINLKVIHNENERKKRCYVIYILVKR